MKRAFVTAAVFASAVTLSQATARLPSADGQFWDIQDTSPWAQDSGGIATGGGANPFNGFGYLKLDVRTAPGASLAHNLYLRGFGLAYDGAERVDSITPVLVAGIAIDRGIFAPRETNYLRYVDTYTNTTTESRLVRVAWGGAAGAYEDGGRVTVAATGSGDRTIDPSDGFVTVMQNATSASDPAQGPSGHGPSAHVLGTRTAGLVTRPGDMFADPFVNPWPGYDSAHIGYVFAFTVRPGEAVSLMTFVVKGLSEVYDPRGGFPIALKDALVAPKNTAPYSGPAPRIPAAGSQIAAVTETARRLLAEPDVRGLTARQRARLLNWPPPASTPAPFTVVEKTAPQLQEALSRGAITSEDIVREYLVRLATHDRNGVTLRSVLALNPRVVHEARALDAERAAGKVRSALHGVPVAFKDNIDVLGLPTTGGALALIDHRPRLDSRVAAGMRRAGAIVLGKTNLDEFPFGDFGISTVGGTIGNAYDASLSTAGSSGGSAVAVASSLVTIGFGTDTCNSLSNPAAFASLATIRTTRGLTSRAGVMPLNTFNDAVGPMTKSVRELALVLDQVAGVDPEDPVTQDAGAHTGQSFASGLDGASLKGKRIAVLRQLFVGVTGEREAAAEMERVIKELRAAGATVIDASIPDLDDEYRQARGSAPGSLKAGWTAYLTRGSKGGDRVFTIEELIASGRMAPDGTRRLQDALRSSADGEQGREAVERFLAGRLRFRDLFEAVMDSERVDALLYPANQARPHTHEGGLERYGGEPGTCEPSAMTGLPQVTVPAGFLGGRYPFGVSFLGRLWSDRDLLALAHAYEQATHHRRPPGARERREREPSGGA